MAPKLIHVCTVPITLKLFMRGQIAYVKSRGFEIAAAASPGPDLEEVAERDGIRVYAVCSRGAVACSGCVVLAATDPAVSLLEADHRSFFHQQSGPLSMLAAYLTRVPYGFTPCEG